MRVPFQLWYVNICIALTVYIHSLMSVAGVWHWYCKHNITYSQNGGKSCQNCPPQFVLLKWINTIRPHFPSYCLASMSDSQNFFISGKSRWQRTLKRLANVAPLSPQLPCRCKDESCKNARAVKRGAIMNPLTVSCTSSPLTHVQQRATLSRKCQIKSIA